MRPSILLIFIALFLQVDTFAQKRKKEATSTSSTLEKTDVSGLKFRSVGPALASGRISDFAFNPQKLKEYYVATSSSGVWKTKNGGVTYQPIFDQQGSYSIGCVTLDPNNPNVVWVGSGENNNQRSVAYGDGVYKSEDGGATWKHMGLKTSEHIGSIVIDPRDSKVVYVAAIGPLWSKGGERGVYKTTDGGETWNAVLTIDEHTGINEVLMDPRNPEVLYANALQRRRHVFTYLGGGPGSGVYRSTDAGETWEKINKGLPTVDMGRIGMAISPADPEILYAIVEAAENKGGFYRSTNRGASWERRGSFVTSGNYYQELVADPKNPDKVFAMDTYLRVSTDGGKSFNRVMEQSKHVDNHCMWIDPADTDHWIVGCDGGIYETWDHSQTWHFKENLPITQFYKVEVDNSKPFYYIYGGTQDNNSLGGPSRSTSSHGIANEEWFVTNGGDGFESQIDPDDPNIVYAQAQYGILVRYDRQSGEKVGIQPKPGKEEPAYRWNWDAPLATSSHQPGRVYFAANKLFRSDNRGNSWEVISPDLTQQINRNELKIMDRVWSVDAVAKNRSTSPYGTIVAFSESPVNQDLLYVGTDDGLIQITTDGGQNWKKVGSFPGIPDRTYVNMVLGSQHNEQVVYAAFNNHKNGDFKPYLLKSSNGGTSWTSIANNLPERGSVYSIAEDHVDPNLLFVGTEFGVFFSSNGGQEWKQLKAGLPVIAVRDIAIQKRENDLVLGTFGRSFYVLDDYAALRNLGEEALAQEATLFPVRDALSFEASGRYGGMGKADQGDGFYTAENLGSEAIFTFYLKEKLQTMKEIRQEEEKKAREGGGDNPYPTYDQLKAEREETSPSLLLTVTNSNNEVVRKLSTAPKAGIARVHWDLRYPSKDPINLKTSPYRSFFGTSDASTLVSPGTYQVTLSKNVNGTITQLAGPVSFEVRPLNNRTLPGDPGEVVAFQEDLRNLSRALQGTQRAMGEVENQLKHLKQAILRVRLPQEEFAQDFVAIRTKLMDLKRQLNYDPVAGAVDRGVPMTVGQRLNLWDRYLQEHSTAAPTETFQQNVAIAREEFEPILASFKQLVNEDLSNLQQRLNQAGVPYTPYALPVLDY